MGMTTLSNTWQAQVAPGQLAGTLVSDGHRPEAWIQSVLSNRPVYHLFFWLFIFGFNAAYIAFIGEDRDVSLYNLALRIPFILACCYLNLYWLMPRYYGHGLLVQYGLLVLCLIFLLNAVNLYLLGLFVESPICPTTFEADATFNGSNYVYKGFYLFSLVGLTSGIKLSKDHLANRQRAEAIEKEKLQTELSLLKSQINPHFFFNTLNNLYALTIKKSDSAPDVVLKLSDLMSYSLYESEGSSVSLDKEIGHITNYIELEGVRLGSKMKVAWEVRGATAGVEVPPLIFLPLVENCFKHAASRKQGGIIRMVLTVSQDWLTLETSNPFDTSNPSATAKGGLGLRNLQRRLELLFGSRFVYHAQAVGSDYFSSLKIPSRWSVA